MKRGGGRGGPSRGTPAPQSHVQESHDNDRENDGGDHGGDGVVDDLRAVLNKFIIIFIFIIFIFSIFFLFSSLPSLNQTFKNHMIMTEIVMEVIMVVMV